MHTISHEQQDVFVRWDPEKQVEVRRRVTEHEYSTDLRACPQCGLTCRVRLERTPTWSIYPGARICNGCQFANATYQQMRHDRATDRWEPVGERNPLAGISFSEWAALADVPFSVPEWGLPSFDKAMGIRDANNVHQGTADEYAQGGFDEDAVSANQ